jgi:hypothetical protein
MEARYSKSISRDSRNRNHKHREASNSRDAQQQGTPATVKKLRSKGQQRNRVSDNRVAVKNRDVSNRRDASNSRDDSNSRNVRNGSDANNKRYANKQFIIR